MMTRSLNTTFAAALILAAGAALASDQPQWGQKHSRNLASDETGLADTFDPATKKNVKWVAKLGSVTHSSPIVAGGRVFIGTNNEVPRNPRHIGDRGVIMCFDEKDGSLLWQLVVPKMEADPFLDWPKMGICSPPTVEGDKVYVATNRGEIMCLDSHGLANGNDGYADEGKHMAPAGAPPEEVSPTDADILWLFDMPREVGVHLHDSTHVSILADGNFLYVNTCNGVDNTHRKIRSPNAPSLIVLDKTTGKLLAQDGESIGPRIFHCTWSSPALGLVNGRKRIFFGGGDGVCYAFEALGEPLPAELPLTLKRVWRFDCDPTAPKENVSQYQGNRKISPSNISGMPVFYKDRVYIEAGGDVWHGKPQAWLKCIDATKSGDITQGGELWSYPLSSHSMTTPAIHDGLLYATDCGRKVHCVDAETGKPYWTHDTKGEFWGSTLVADGKLFFGTRKGDFWILAAGKEKKVLSTIELGNPISGTPTAANGVVYIATMTQLFAVKKSE